MTPMRKLAAFLAAATLALSLQVAAPVAAEIQDNAAVAINQKDGSSLFKFAFDIRRVMNGVVDQSNAAVAYSSCEECQTVAVAIQLVLVMSDPEVVTPENIALAINYECTLCQTMALAYQIVLTTGGPVRFTAEGNRQLAEIRLALTKLLHSDASLEEIKAQIDALVAQLKEVVATQLVPARPPEDDDTGGGETEDDDDDETTSSPEPTESPEPEETEASPSPTPVESSSP